MESAPAPRGELGASRAATRALVERLGAESAKTAFPAWRIRSFPYPSKENSVHLNAACIPKRYERRKRLGVWGRAGFPKKMETPGGFRERRGIPAEPRSTRPERGEGEASASGKLSGIRSPARYPPAYASKRTSQSPKCGQFSRGRPISCAPSVPNNTFSYSGTRFFRRFDGAVSGESSISSGFSKASRMS